MASLLSRFTQTKLATTPVLVMWSTVLIVLSCSILDVRAIDCFKCVSINGSNPACEDPFHNNFTADILESPCLGGRKGRNGLFPATSCIKLSGTYADTGQRMIIRSCSMDSGSLTLDTELVRMSHCGSFIFDSRYVNGCLQSCDDGDGCNSSTLSTCSVVLLPVAILSALLSNLHL